MIDFFDRLGETLNDIIGTHANNNVSHAVDNIYPKKFAAGGAVTRDNVTDNGTLGDPLSTQNIFRSSVDALNKTVNDPYSAGGRHSAYNDPFFLTPHIQNSYGRFFTGADPGSTNKPIQQPQPNKPLQSEDPETFYSRWYQRMRNFAEADEVASRGQTITRTR